MLSSTLESPLRSVGRRMLAVGTAAAAVWGLVVLMLSVLAAVWLDLLWELAPEVRATTLGAAGAAGLLTVTGSAWAWLRRAEPLRIARRLDAVAGTGGAILSGWELERSLAPGSAPVVAGPPGTLSAGLARLAVGQAAKRAASIEPSSAVPWRPLHRAALTFAVLLFGVLLLAALAPAPAKTQWHRFTSPWGDVPPYSFNQLVMHPGDVEVVYGDPLELLVDVTGPPVDQVDLVMTSRGQGPAAEVVPMFPDAEGQWRVTLTRVTEPLEYFARAHRARSRRHEVSVITVPRITEVRVRVTPPEYTAQRTYEGPVPAEGIAGLPRTVVEVFAASNRTLSGGSLEVVQDRDSESLPMIPSGGTENRVGGRFEIRDSGRFELRVEDEQGEWSRDVFSAAITREHDEPPWIQIVHPQRLSLATPEVNLPVQWVAEDDYGVTRVSLYRSLNDSRPLPMTWDLSDSPQRMAARTLELPLSEYRLQPGDVIKLFGRVEDNDPDGPNAAESSVVTVHIVSQAEFEELLRARAGLETLVNKHQEARRQLESLAEQADRLLEQLDQALREEDAERAGELRDEIERLAVEMREAAQRFDAGAKHPMPLDADQNLASHLKQLAGELSQAADELSEALAGDPLDAERLQEALRKAVATLQRQRGEHGERAMIPLEILEAAFPLMAKAATFQQLVWQQRDLAERMAVLQGHDRPEDPVWQGRMREFQDQQREIRQQLDQLLDEIEQHAERLPNDPMFDELRATAMQFAADVRGCGAIEVMEDGERALAETAGSRAHEAARRAAELLEKFLEACDSLGQCAGDCLSLRFSVAQALGATAQQLLASMGFGTSFGAGTGFGAGSGIGAGTGTGARRSPFSNMGLYGQLPGLTTGPSLAGGWGESTSSGQLGRGTLGMAAGQEPPDGPFDQPALGQAAGGAALQVPPRYRQRVGQYFRRISEELEEGQ